MSQYLGGYFDRTASASTAIFSQKKEMSDEERQLREKSAATMNNFTGKVILAADGSYIEITDRDEYEAGVYSRNL